MTVDLSQLPAPLVPPELDLRGYMFMPLFGDALFRSAFEARATPEEFKAGVRLWWSAWWETPGSSLPNNERDLAKLAGLSLRRWRRARALLMEKWVLCSDDRWYHPFLAGIARDAFAKRVSASVKGATGAKKRWGNNGTAHASANGTGNAPAIKTNSSGIAPATEIDSTGNSNRSEVNTPLPPEGRSRSKPRATAGEIKTQQHLAEQRSWNPAPPPGGISPLELYKQATTKAKPEAKPFEDTDP